MPVFLEFGRILPKDIADRLTNIALCYVIRSRVPQDCFLNIERFEIRDSSLQFCDGAVNLVWRGPLLGFKFQWWSGSSRHRLLPCLEHLQMAGIYFVTLLPLPWVEHPDPDPVPDWNLDLGLVWCPHQSVDLLRPPAGYSALGLRLRQSSF